MKKSGGRDGEVKGWRKAMNNIEKRETGRNRRLRIRKSETGSTHRDRTYS